jgi:hypothetical protein
MTFSGRILTNEPVRPAHYLNEGVLVAPGLVACEFVGQATITTTGATQWSVVDRNNSQGVIPIGARIYRVAMVIPAGLVATNTNLLKVADAIGDAASANNLLSTAASSATYAAETALKDTAFPGNSTALSAAQTIRLFSAATGGTTAGSAVSVASGEAKILVQVCYTIPAPVASTTDYRAINARSRVDYP